MSIPIDTPIPSPHISIYPTPKYHKIKRGAKTAPPKQEINIFKTLNYI
jgi:hypothetical protein